MIKHRDSPLPKFVHVAIAFCMITITTTRNYIVKSVSNTIINSVYAIIDIYSIEVRSVFSRYLTRRYSTIMARFRCNFPYLIFSKIPHIVSFFCLFLKSMIKSIKGGLTFFYFYQTSTTLSAVCRISQVVSYQNFLISTIASTQPCREFSSIFLDSKSVLTYYNQLSKSIPCNISKLHNLPSFLKEYSQKLVLLSRQYLYNFWEQFTSISPIGFTA